MGLCFLRELLAADVRLAFDSIVPPPLPPSLAPGSKKHNRKDGGAHSWGAADGRAGSAAAVSVASFQHQHQQPYQRLHFALWPIDDLLLEADAAIAAASWFPSSLTNLLPGSFHSSSSDGSSKDEVYGGSGATHSSHFFGLWPRAVPHLGHLGTWYRCVRLLIRKLIDASS